MIVVSFDIGIKNLAWSVFENCLPPKFISGGVTSICTTKKKTTAIVVQNFVKWLQTSDVVTKDSLVLCEQQLGQASMNKILSMALLSYCTILGTTCKFVSSNTKFKGMPDELFPLSVNKNTICEQSYAKRKKASVDLMLHIAGHFKFTNATEIAKTLKKKDDFADSFCQAIFYLYSTL